MSSRYIAQKYKKTRLVMVERSRVRNLVEANEFHKMEVVVNITGKAVKKVIRFLKNLSF